MEISSLLNGVGGAVVISVFSSDIPGSFLVPRTLKATAVLFAEPTISSTSKQSSYSTTPGRHSSCPKTILPLGRKLKVAEEKIAPIIKRLSKITTPISNAQSRLSGIASSIVQKLRLQCLIPKLTRPFEPIFKFTRCVLGLSSDGFMKNTSSCNKSLCNNPTTEHKIISHDRGLPNLDSTIEGQVSTMDDCFTDMEKVVYGTRIRVRIVDDESCDEPQYEQICQDAISQNRIVLEESCQSQRQDSRI